MLCKRKYIVKNISLMKSQTADILWGLEASAPAGSKL